MMSLASVEPFSTSANCDPVTFSIPFRLSLPSPEAVPAARSTVTPTDADWKRARSMPPLPVSVSSPAPPFRVSSPPPAFRMLASRRR